jgi:hypothetical protein
VFQTRSTCLTFDISLGDPNTHSSNGLKGRSYTWDCGVLYIICSLSQVWIPTYSAAINYIKITLVCHAVNKLITISSHRECPGQTSPTMHPVRA